MAVTDDCRFLIPFIRRSFITGDDTSFCERVIGDENIAATDVLAMLSETYVMAEQAASGAHSPDINIPQRRTGNLAVDTSKRRARGTDSSYGSVRTDVSSDDSHRKLKTSRRFLAARDGEEAQAESEAAAKASASEKILLSLDVNSKLDERLVNELFLHRAPLKTLVSEVVQEDSKRGSLCSTLLEEAQRRSEANPFTEFARFDARGAPNARTYEVFYSFANVAPRGARSSQKVAVVGDTLVREAIGCALLCYVQQKIQPELPLLPTSKTDVNQLLDSFDLFIADDDGSAELDFPRLEPTDQIGKYDFVRLALVRHEQVVQHNSVDAFLPLGPLFTGSEGRNLRRSASHTTDNYAADREKKRSGSESASQLVSSSPTRRADTFGAPQSGVTQLTPDTVRPENPLLMVQFSESDAAVFNCTLLKRKKLFAFDAVLRITVNLVEIEPNKPSGATRLWSNLSGVARRKCYRHFLEHVVVCTRPEKVSKGGHKMTFTIKCLTNEQVFQ